MIRATLVASLLAGLVAGLVLTGVQALGVTPLILEAETHEGGAGAAAGPAAAGDHAHAAGAPHGDAAWAPADGLERTLWTAVANVGAATGFALLLGALFAWRGRADWRQGLVWGGAGFVVFFANPALGLHPELPGTYAAALGDRQLWWLLTAACSAAGVGLLLLAPKAAWKIAGAALLAVPHLVGAPHPAEPGGLAPQALAHAFVTTAWISNAVFWAILGLATALAYRHLARE